MRKSIWVFAMLAAVACGRGPGPKNRAESGVRDSLKLDKSLGRVVERRFEGVVPGREVPGVRYVLILYNQEYSATGVFELHRTYLTGEDDPCCLHASGRWTTLKIGGGAEDSLAISLNEFDSDDYRYFTYLTDSLVMLDSGMKRIPSEVPYTLYLHRDQSKKR